MDTTWKQNNYEMAFLKVNSADKPDLEAMKEVKSTDEVSLLVYYKDFEPGNIVVELAIFKEMKLIFWISPGSKGPDLTCGGSEIELSTD